MWELALASCGSLTGRLVDGLNFQFPSGVTTLDMSFWEKSRELAFAAHKKVVRRAEVCFQIYFIKLQCRTVSEEKSENDAPQLPAGEGFMWKFFEENGDKRWHHVRLSESDLLRPHPEPSQTLGGHPF